MASESRIHNRKAFGRASGSRRRGSGFGRMTAFFLAFVILLTGGTVALGETVSAAGADAGSMTVRAT